MPNICTNHLPNACWVVVQDAYRQKQYQMYYYVILKWSFSSHLLYPGSWTCSHVADAKRKVLSSNVAKTFSTVWCTTVYILFKDGASVHINYGSHYFHAFSSVGSIHSGFPLGVGVHTAQLRQVREHLPVLTHKALIAILSRMLFLLTPIINSCLSFSTRWWCSSWSHSLVFHLKQSCFAKGDDGYPSNWG